MVSIDLFETKPLDRAEACQVLLHRGVRRGCQRHAERTQVAKSGGSYVGGRYLPDAIGKRGMKVGSQTRHIELRETVGDAGVRRQTRRARGEQSDSRRVELARSEGHATEPLERVLENRQGLSELLRTDIPRNQQLS